VRRLLVLGAVLATAGSARAQSSVVAGGAELDEATGELALFVDGRAADGAPTPVVDPQLFLDGKGPISPQGKDKLLDYAAERPKWTPPFAISVVYMWNKGAPQTMMDGLEALFRHVPGKVPVYPTPYGQGYRQVVTKLTAARIAGGDLADYPQMAGEQHKLVEAVQLNVGKLAEDRAPIKLLFIITDGRGPASGGDFGPFAALGEDLRRQGIQVAIVSLPAPVDANDATANVQELKDAARARLIKVERLTDLPTSIELLGETVASVERIHFELPWLTRQLGGEHKILIKGAVAGSSVRSQSMTIMLPRQAGMLVAVVVGSLLAVVGLVIGVRLMRGRPAAPARAPRNATPPPGRAPPTGRAAPPSSRTARPEPEEEEEEESDPLTEAMTEVVRAGGSPARAVLALARALGPRTEELADKRTRADGVLGTKAGQARLRELRKLLVASAPRETFLRDVAPILGGAMREQAPPREGARRLRARLPIEGWTTVLRLSPEEMDSCLAATTELAGQAARGFVRSVQEELQRSPSGGALTVWLVRVAGPGQPGETLVIGGNSVLGGPGADVPLGDDRAAASHAEISLEDNDASISPLEGKVEVDGAEAAGPTPLHDGQTLALGRSLFVVRIVRRDITLAERKGPSRAGRAGAVPRAGGKRR
jgi:hypothetical protein